MSLTAVGLWLALERCPVERPEPAHAGPGAPTAPAVPEPKATALNNQGKALYRQGRWADARARYESALAIDPAFLAPALNRACTYAREGRFADAAAAAEDLVRRGYVPWAREVKEAADLAALHARPESRRVAQALEESRQTWGRIASEGLPVVTRLRPPVRLTGTGVLALVLHQEIVAWFPRSGRYLPLTAEDGRVLALARSPDGAVLLYVTGSKLVREPGRPTRLRGLAVRTLEVATMTEGPRLPVEGDVVSLDLGFDDRGHPLLIVEREGAPRAWLRLALGQLIPSPLAVLGAFTRLTGEGASPARLSADPGSCRFELRDDRAGDTPVVLVKPRRGRPFPLATPHGAGVGGLPFPGSSPRPATRP